MPSTSSTRWFFSDWLSDPGLRASSLAARGLWKDLLCVMGSNAGADYGYLKINGRIPSLQTIARLVQAPAEEVNRLTAELELNGVFSRTRNGTIYCRRMRRQQIARANGKLGGNPNLLKPKETPVSVNPSPNLHIPIPIPRKKDAAKAAPEDSEKANGHDRHNPEADLFRRGREVLGATAGGLVKKLLEAKGSIAMARAALEAASEKANPREYIGGVIRAASSEPERGWVR